MNKPWLMPKYGETALQDFWSKGRMVLRIWPTHREGTNSYEETVKKPLLHYITPDSRRSAGQSVQTGIKAGSTRILVDGANMVRPRRPASGHNLHLWTLDNNAGFKPIPEYELPGTDKLDGYVIHTLRLRALWRRIRWRHCPPDDDERNLHGR